MIIEELVHFFVGHGYALLFAWVLADQLGVPVPVFPVLLGAGALAGAGQFDLATAIPLAALASLLGGFLWYEIGRRRGGVVLRCLCRLSLKPDACVRRTEDIFVRHGRTTLVWARFVPGLSAIVSPLAGIFALSRLHFLLFSALGALLWASSFLLLGYLFSHQLEQAVSWFGHLKDVLIVLVLPLLGYLGFKYWQRRRFHQTLAGERIEPEEVKTRLDAGEDLVILDLRHPLDLRHEPRTLPGALHLTLDELEERSAQLPADREFVLFCNCPHEATSARIAHQLKNRGIPRVRPLAGGLEGWMQRGFPLGTLPPAKTENPLTGEPPC